MGQSQLNAGAVRVAVVGGGASGLACAIACARSGAQVHVLEASARPGRSILASGNGRCNLSNTHLSANDFNNPQFVSSVLGTDPFGNIRKLFDSLGVLFLPDEEGRCYPASRHASSVLDPLLDACAQLGVTIKSGARVESLVPPRFELGDTHWQVGVRQALPSKNGRAKKSSGASLERLTFDRVVWAAGGGSAPEIFASLGVEVIPSQPVLCPIATETAPVAGLNGVRTQARLRLLRGGSAVPGADLRGEVLFRPYGVSGIAVFDLSRIALPGDILALDLLPDFDAGVVEDIVLTRARHLGSTDQNLANGRDDAAGERATSKPGFDRQDDPVLGFLDGVAHPALASKIMRAARSRAGNDPRKLATQAATMLKDYRLEVIGVADTDHAQVTRGGVALTQVDPADLQMRNPALAGLYCCGEALDIDARCGGFNLSWAWLSGTVAGIAAARRRSSQDTYRTNTTEG